MVLHVYMYNIFSCSERKHRYCEKQRMFLSLRLHATSIAWIVLVLRRNGWEWFVYEYVSEISVCLLGWYISRGIKLHTHTHHSPSIRKVLNWAHYIWQILIYLYAYAIWSRHWKCLQFTAHTQSMLWAVQFVLNQSILVNVRCSFQVFIV